MKKGKTSKIQGFKTAKVLFGTVDSVKYLKIFSKSYKLKQPPENRQWDEQQTEILKALGFTDSDLGTDNAYVILKSLYDSKCSLTSNLNTRAECQPIRDLLTKRKLKQDPH